ncbi:hypothetical protein HAX54_026438 [Datura stramonium]|uniref:Uncharacterized protein n=1 Tax=Datura stramonium TaxID=4076 RepID=A0ABS8V290_DATST|nr:hypothetical protein [Datura stramonium]
MRISSFTDLLGIKTTLSSSSSPFSSLRQLFRFCLVQQQERLESLDGDDDEVKKLNSLGTILIPFRSFDLERALCDEGTKQRLVGGGWLCSSQYTTKKKINGIVFTGHPPLNYSSSPRRCMLAGDLRLAPISLEPIAET